VVNDGIPVPDTVRPGISRLILDTLATTLLPFDTFPFNCGPFTANSGINN
jgi:hypothetical protein